MAYEWSQYDRLHFSQFWHFWGHPYTDAVADDLCLFSRNFFFHLINQPDKILFYVIIMATYYSIIVQIWAYLIALAIILWLLELHFLRSWILCIPRPLRKLCNHTCSIWYWSKNAKQKYLYNKQHIWKWFPKYYLHTWNRNDFRAK